MELDRVDPLGLAEAEETQGSRDWNFLEIRLAKETSWDVALVCQLVVLLNRNFVVPFETVEVGDLMRLGRLGCPWEAKTTSRECSKYRMANFLELFGRRSRAGNCKDHRLRSGTIG